MKVFLGPRVFLSLAQNRTKTFSRTIDGHLLSVPSGKKLNGSEMMQKGKNILSIGNRFVVAQMGRINLCLTN